MTSAPEGSGPSSELAKEIAVQLSSPAFLDLIKEAVRAVREEEKMEEEAERAARNPHSVRISGEQRPDKGKRSANGSNEGRSCLHSTAVGVSPTRRKGKRGKSR